MKSINMKVTLLQSAVIVLMSLAAYYAFQHTETAYEISGLCFYRYFAYAITVVLVYLCFSQYKQSIGIASSVALSAVAVSPLGYRAIELFPVIVPFLAVSMGITTVLIFPRRQGRGFFEFLLVLILPAILAVSRIGGSDGLLATTSSIGYYQLSAITVVLLGGYFYLRYAALTSMSSLKLLSNGANERDVGKILKSCNIVILLIAICASGIATLLLVTVPIVADALRVAAFMTPLTVLALAMGVGIVIMTAFYIFRLSRRSTPA